jgi:hypothetical protein
MTCTPSARLEEQFPNTTSVYAEEGTAAHALAEIFVNYHTGKIGVDPFDAALEAFKGNEYANDEMYTYILGYASYITELFNEVRAATQDALLESEVKLDLSKYVPGGFGTSDVIIIADGMMNVIDLKYGKGVSVSAENNKQMMIYALGALEQYGWMYDIKNVRMTVYQPRLDNISAWEISAGKLLSWAETALKPKAEMAFDGAGEYQAGEHCRFCRAKAVCRARAEANLRLAQYEFKPGTLLSDAEIGDILKIAENLKNWVDNVTAYALEQAINGVKYEGWKLVEGRSVRVIDEKEAAPVLEGLYGKDQIYNVKLKGIGDLEKLMGKKEFNAAVGPLISRPLGKPTLVPETDKRPEWKAAAAADFEDADLSNLSA